MSTWIKDITRGLLLAILLVATTSCVSQETQPITAQQQPTAESSPMKVELPPQWTSTISPTSKPMHTMEPATPTFEVTDTPKPLVTKRPTITAAPTFSLEVGSPEDVVQRAYAAFLREDERELETLLTKDAADMCRGLGSIVRCFEIGYDFKGLEQILNWYVNPDRTVTVESTMALVSVISSWAGSTKQWQHYFILWKEDGIWLIEEPYTEIYEYVP